MEFNKIMTMCQERQGFHLCRATTGDDYIFIHFLSPTEVVIKGEWQKIKKGGCVFWRCESYQEYKSPDSILLHNYFHVRKESAPELEMILSRYGIEFETVYYPGEHTEITNLIQQIEIEGLKKQLFHQQIFELKFQELLIILARSQDETDRTPVDNETYKRFTSLRQQFHAEFNKNWSVSDMATVVNLSPSRFYSLYKQIFGISPKKDFLQIRIEHTKKLMQQDSYSIREIAEMAGYNNQYHFIRQFREVTGTTPGKFIKNRNRY